MSDRLRLIVVDDHTLVRSGFLRLLEEVDGFEIVADAPDAETALRLVEAHQPDIVVTDIAMPGMSGIDLTRQVVNQWPNVRCLVLSMHKSGPYIKSALDAGASGYLLKDSASNELVMAVKAVGRGETYLSPKIASLVLTGGPLSGLTKRQTEVLQMIAKGESTKGIALQLGLSPKTIETHRAELMKRLNIYDVAGLVRFAIREGLVAADE